jgi:hypothetical protein
MGLDYPTVKKLYDAQQLIASYGHLPIEKTGDRAYQIRGGWLTGNISYSQQEFTIKPSFAYRSEDVRHLLTKYPVNVGRVYYHRPSKEYISFKDGAGVLRYYVMPPDGLRIQRDGSGYKAVNPVRDYRIVVDRTAAKEARKPAEDLIKYVTLLWEMIPPPPEDERPWYVPETIPDVDDRISWQDFLKAAKYAHMGPWALSTTQQKLRAHFTAESLAYKVTPVPDTETDHTEHWDKLSELRRAGKLEKFEGPVKKKRTRKKKADGVAVH